MATWKINFVEKGTVRNIQYAEIDQKIDNFDEFKIILANPNAWQRDDISDDIECQIDAGNHQLYGYVKNHKQSTANQTKTVSGYDYAIKLAKVLIHKDNTSHEDARSSGFRVIYDDTAFATIAADILTNSGFSAGTIDTYPPAGPDTNMDVKFEYMYVLDALKYLANTAQVSNVSYDLWIDTSKNVQLQARRGSDTPVIDFRDGDNCTVLNWEGDTIRKAKRVIVLGDRTGTNQIQGMWPTAGFSTGDPEVVYYSPEVSDSTAAQTLAKNIYTAMSGEVTYIRISVGNSNANVQIGDDVNFISDKMGITSTEYRVVRLKKTYESRRGERLYLYLSVTGNKQRKKTLAEIIGENKGLRKISGSTSKGNIRTLSWGAVINAHGTNKSKLGFNIDSSVVLDNSDIIEGRLNVKRIALTYDTDSATDQHLHEENFFSQDYHTAQQNAPGQNDHAHSITGISTDTDYSYSAGYTSQIDENLNCPANEFTQVATVSVPNPADKIDNESFHYVKIWLKIVDGETIPEHIGLRFRYSGIVTSTFYMETVGTQEYDPGTFFDKWVLLKYIIQPDLYLRCGNNIYFDVNPSAATKVDGIIQAGIARKHEHDISGKATQGNQASFDQEPTTENTLAIFESPEPDTENEQAGIPRGSYAPGGESAHNFKYDLDGADQGTWNNLAVDGTASATVMPSSTGQHYFEIYPTGASEIATLVVTYELDVFVDEV
jgi:hypothetical protein